MPSAEITRFPPILQLVALALLGGFVAVSVLGRLSARFRWLWRDVDEVHTREHLIEYTLVPALLFAGAVAAVVLEWDPGVPLGGGWSLRELTVGPTAAALGMIVLVLATAAGRHVDTSDASRARAWVPLALFVVGIALLAVGVLTLGRTVKRYHRSPRVGQALGQHAPGTAARPLCVGDGRSVRGSRRPRAHASARRRARGCAPAHRPLRDRPQAG